MASTFRRIGKQFERELQYRAQKHTTMLRYHAVLAGWPTEIVDKIHLRLNKKGQYRAMCAKGFRNHILDWEEGNSERPPSPVVRNYMSMIGVN